MLTWWDGSNWTDRRTPIPGGPLDPKTASAARRSDDDVPPGELGDDAERPHENSGPIPVIETGEPTGEGDPIFADPTSVFAPVAPEPPADYHRDGGEERSRPRLLLVLLPLFFIGLAAAALIATSGSDDDNPKKDDNSNELTTIGEAVEIAEKAGLPINLAGSTVGSLIDDICDAAGKDGADATLATRISQLPIQSAQVHDLLNGLGKGAAVRCPDAVAADSGLLLRTGELAIAKLGTGTSTTLSTGTTEVASPPTTGATTAGGTGGSTATTKKPATATTRATPTTTATTAAPTTTVTTAPVCSPNYSKCLNPAASSYNCVGKQGDPDWRPYSSGPTVSGPFTVTGNDVYDLDVDGNGIACERAAQT
jgi:hypothetical protein